MQVLGVQGFSLGVSGFRGSLLSFRCESRGEEGIVGPIGFGSRLRVSDFGRK